MSDDAMGNPPSTDPRSLPFYKCSKGERRFLVIKQKLTEEQIRDLRSNMNIIRVQQLAEVQRTADTATARRDGTS
jgi:hypothetical protein